MRILILKEEQMQQQTPSTLDAIYGNWSGYHEKLRDCIAPLTNEQLVLQPAAHVAAGADCAAHHFCQGGVVQRHPPG
jgi:hypothetical protein